MPWYGEIMDTPVQITAILLMGGKGARFKSATPKQFHRLAGKKIYLHTLERFLKSELFGEIILVCPEEWVQEVSADIAGYEGNIRVVIGGSSRQESSYLGLLACTSETSHVVIHDAVRPFVSQEILERNVEACKLYEAVDTCTPSADTIVHSENGAVIDAIPTRAHYLRGQTPQSFSLPLILHAHEAAKARGSIATDDCALMLALGHKVHIVEGEESNIKITTDLDLYLAEQLFRRTCASFRRQITSDALKGKRYAITGGTGDIGTAIATELKKAGAEPLLIARHSTPYSADLTSAEQTEEVFKQIFSEVGEIDGLINCVGLLNVKEVSALTAEEIEQLVAVNLTSVIHACKYAKIKPSGAILNIASSAYSRGRKGYAIYSAAKAAVVNFTQALAEERPGLFINALAPQRTESRMRALFFPEENPATLLSPKQIAEQVLSLLQEGAITGMTIDVRQEVMQAGSLSC